MSQVTAHRHKKKPVVAKKYASEGCPVEEDGEDKCGETQGLEILDDFDKLYKDKMNEIDVIAGGDNLQEKVDLQQQWIDDLTDQNRLLAKVIQELENESIARIQQLDDKMKNAVKSLGENDKQELADKDKKIKELQDAVKEADVLRKKAVENEKLKQSMEEIRTAFTEDVACKYDTITLLRHKVYQLEQSNSDTRREASLKDDIIKELRKELKKMKHKASISIAHQQMLKNRDHAITSEKSTNTTESEFITINHSTCQQSSNNSTIIFLHKGQIDKNDRELTSFESSKSSDSSEYECNASICKRIGSSVYSSRSENNMKQINWKKPTKERSKLTRLHKDFCDSDSVNGQGQREKTSLKKFNIPKHVPVKTYVNNIEYTTRLE